MSVGKNGILKRAAVHFRRLFLGDAPLGARRFSGDKMNRTFQVAFNAARGLMTVTSEVTRRKTKIGAKAVVIGTAALLTGGGDCSCR